MPILKVATVLSSLIQFTLLFWLFFKKKFKTPSEKFLIMFTLNGALYCLFIFLYMIEPRQQNALLNSNIAIFFSCFYFLFVLLFSISFTNKKIHAANLILVILTCIFCVYFWYNLIVKIDYGKWGWYPETNYTAARIWALFACGCITGTLWHMHKIIVALKKNNEKNLKKRMSYVSYSIFGLSVLALLSYLLNYLPGNEKLPLFFPAFFFIPSLFTVFAMIKKD